MTGDLTFESLVRSMEDTDSHLRVQVHRAVNVGLTLRNWCFGMYIAEFELRGLDRARYGERLLESLSHELTRRKVSNTGRRQLYQYLSFYRVYPRIVRTVPAQSIWELPGPLDLLQLVRTASAQSDEPTDIRLDSLSYSHFELLVGLDGEEKRRFYEGEAICGQWAVRDLRRQISSLLFERTRLSTKPSVLTEKVRESTRSPDGVLTLRDPYVFEFVGLRPREAMTESRLEEALIDKVQEFLLELGRGFCFEARQKRLRIGDDFFFVDLVFYHRILKCHVLIELKADEFRHEHLGQLNTYVNWFSRNERTDGDNPPIGLLLCTRKNHALVEYALAGMDNQIFVSRYQVELPRKEDLERLITMESAEGTVDGGAP
jgi:predicted nuclease of restriction endonuclease-like (RecB) superfamily